MEDEKRKESESRQNTRTAINERTKRKTNKIIKLTTN